MNRLLLLPLLLLAAVFPHVVSADSRQLLESAVEKWVQDADRWSFVQHVREYRGDRVSEERIERFDPSRPDTQRWQLIAVNDRPPTPAEVRTFDARKNRKPRTRVPEPLRYIDFDHLRVVAETHDAITFDVPLRGDLSFFIPFEVVSLRVEIDRASASIRHVEVGLLEEMRIAFGMARVTQLAARFQLPAVPDSSQLGPNPSPTAQPPAPIPLGRASATMSKLGKRLEFSWSDFAPVRS